MPIYNLLAIGNEVYKWLLQINDRYKINEGYNPVFGCSLYFFNSVDTIILKCLFYLAFQDLIFPGFYPFAELNHHL